MNIPKSAWHETSITVAYALNGFAQGKEKKISDSMKIRKKRTLNPLHFLLLYLSCFQIKHRLEEGYKKVTSHTTTIELH